MGSITLTCRIMLYLVYKYLQITNDNCHKLNLVLFDLVHKRSQMLEVKCNEAASSPNFFHKRVQHLENDFRVTVSYPDYYTSNVLIKQKIRATSVLNRICDIVELIIQL